MLNTISLSHKILPIAREKINFVLNAQQKKVLIIGTLALGLLTAALYLASRYFCKSKPSEVIVLKKDGESMSSETVKKEGESKPVSNLANRVVIVANKSIFMQHLTGPKHPEAPGRVEAIEKALIAAELMNDNNRISPRQATLDEIALCHDKSYVETLEKNKVAVPHLKMITPPLRNVPDNVPGDVNISPKTYEVSLYAAGAPLSAIEYILDKKNQTNRAFCIVRPPGHHAHQQSGSGFCVFNNVAIAAKHLTQNLGFKRVLIVDWDAHHGDGTQKLTEEDPKIFYFSTHHDTSAGKGFYPYNNWGNTKQQGVGEGMGTVLNCPIFGSDEKCREEILNAFKNKLVPAMDKYQPDFVLISCGFDAHKNDKLAGMGLKDEDYREMTSICAQIADKYAGGRIVSVLEGGYNLDAISGAAKVHVQTLQKAS